MSQVGVVAGMQILLTVQAAAEAAHGVRSYAIAYYVGCGVALGRGGGRRLRTPHPPRPTGNGHGSRLRCGARTR